MINAFGASEAVKVRKARNSGARSRRAAGARGSGTFVTEYLPVTTGLRLDFTYGLFATVFPSRSRA